MTLFFDTKAQFLDENAISTVCAWHPSQSLFAVASYNQDRGASITLFDDTGEPLRDVTFPVHTVSHATAMCWHPERRHLVAGWENGELNAWFTGNSEFVTINGPHKSPIVYVGFSEHGGRMITADSMGILTGWRCDQQGHFLTMFTHELRDPVLHVTFRQTVQNFVTTELNNLAKAAVAGDEAALDTLTNWRPRTAARNLTHAGVKDNHCFYVGCQAGTMYYINQSGSCTEVLRSESSPVIQVLWHPKREALVVLMEDMTVAHFMVESSGNLTELDRVKLSGRVPGQNGAIAWAGVSVAIITGDFTVRLWDIDTSDSFLLPMKISNTADDNDTNNKNVTNIESSATTYTEGMSTTKTMEVFTCIAYCTSNQTLCAGTNQGNLYTWKRKMTMTTTITTNASGTEEPTNYTVDVPENVWQLNNVSNVRGAIKYCYWGIYDISNPCVLLNCISNVYILKEQPLLVAHCRDLWACQKTATKILVEFSNKRSMLLHGDLTAITGLALSERHLVITNNRSVVVYKITKPDDYHESKNKTLNIKQLHIFHNIDCVQIFLWDEVIIILGQNDIKFYSLGGVVLREIFFNENEGKPIGASLNHHFLSTFTMYGYLKIYDVSRHEPKLLIQPKSGYDLFGNFGEIISAKCNAKGSHLALTIATEALLPDGKLYVLDLEHDILGVCDFLKNQQANDEDSSDMNRKPTISKIPLSFCWDNDDARLLVCEMRCTIQQQQRKRPPTSMSTMKIPTQDQNKLISSANTTFDLNNFAETQAVLMFISNDKCELKEMETINLVSAEQLVDLCTPFLITLKYGQIERHALSNFKGIENCDEATRKIILDFSIFIADGKMDDAFRCIRSIQSTVVWENLARMCVNTGRLDVARVCLGHLNRAMSVRALRLAMEDNTLESEAKIAVLAVELNMIAEAEALYKKCGRYDLLNELLQACGRYEEAVQIAERLDRIHLKNTYFQYAEWLRDQGDVNKALTYYNKSNNATHNITQMLMSGDPSVMKQYMQETTDENLLKWWAQYIESTGDMDEAFKVYQKANDWFSQVRVLCFLGEVARADAIATQSNDKSACYHLARHYENAGRIPEAIQFYIRAQTYGNAVRICKENDLPNELWTVANSARCRDKAVAAAYFEETGDYKRAVELYHRAGMLHKSVEMAFASQQPETLQVIAAELDSTSDPELIERCADFFLKSNQPQKASQLLAITKQYEKSLEICRAHNVPITETLADLLTPVKDDTEKNLEEAARIRILTGLGEILQEQGDYHSATKKFTQAGDKVRAMKSLLKSGDTEKIIFFASMSRQKEVYIMAANYLQSLNWQSDGKILKNIVQFYTKGHAYDLLANFYANCAQVEIDEFHDYDKALKALQEASRCIAKITTTTNAQQHQRVIDNLQNAGVEVKKVIEVQDALDRGDFNNVIAVARSMLTISERPPVRAIHVQAILIEALIRTKHYADALNVLRELQAKSSDWSYKGLIEKSLIEKLAHECGVEFHSIWNTGRRRISHGDTGIEEVVHEVEEDIHEEIE